MKEKVIPEDWGHPIIVRGEVEVKKIGGKKVVFPIRSFSRWAHRALMNFVLPAYASADCKAPISFTHPQIKDIDGNLRSWREDNYYGPMGRYHFCAKLQVGNDATPWDYDDYKLKGPKDEATAYSRRLDTTEENSSIKAEFQGLIQATNTYDIKETGLFGSFAIDPSTTFYFLVSRDVLPSPIPVEPFDVVVVYYRFTVGGT
jgi:hypothetical protein